MLLNASPMRESNNLPPVPAFPVLSIHPELPRIKVTCRKAKYGHGREAETIRKDLDGFDRDQSPASNAVRAAFGSTLRLRELRGIVDTIRAWWQVNDGTYLPPLSRNAKRSFLLTLKYIDEHYDQIVPRFPHVILCDDDGQRIPLLQADMFPQIQHEHQEEH
jgi:hypothetical protein